MTNPGLDLERDLERDFEELLSTLPAKIAPAQTACCPKCLRKHRVPETETRFHGEELCQFRDKFYELMRRRSP